MKDAMPKNKLKWRKDWTGDFLAKCGPLIARVSLHAYTFPKPGTEWIWRVNKTVGYASEYRKTEQGAKSAAESWLSRQVEKMRKDLKGGGK